VLAEDSRMLSNALRGLTVYLQRNDQSSGMLKIDKKIQNNIIIKIKITNN